MSTGAIILVDASLPGRPDMAQCRAAVQALVTAYPVRIQAMLDKILINADNICTYTIGSVELHFKGESLTVKLTQYL